MQKNINYFENIQSCLNSIGCKAAILSIAHINELQKDIECFVSNGFIHKNLGINFNFDWKKAYGDAKSVLIIAIPNLAVDVSFNIKGNILKTIVPPTYVHEKETENVRKVLSKNLASGSYVDVKNMLPLKLLAAKSGMGKYGRNNICYVEGMGSHHRLMAFYLNIEPKDDTWDSLCMLESCNTCSNCIKICPTECIPEDRFLIRAERCLTYFNESERNFPSWLKKEWFNSLFGCMKCQDICPENKSFTGKTQLDFYFDEAEADKILKNKSLAGLEDKTIKKIQDLDFINNAFLFGRNLEALIK